MRNQAIRFIMMKKFKLKSISLMLAMNYQFKNKAFLNKGQ